jgi:YggT family protein
VERCSYRRSPDRPEEYAVTIVGSTLGALLGIAQLVLLARVVLDWATLLAGPPAYDSVRAKATQAVHAITEPVLAPVRRLIPPLRVGSVGIDLAFVIVFILVSVVRSLVSQL